MTKQNKAFNPVNSIGSTTTEVLAALVVWATALEDCAKTAENLSQLSADDKRKWVWNGKNLLVAKPFYAGVYQVLSQHKEIKTKFSNELAYVAQNLKIADVLLQDKRIVAVLLDGVETVH